MRRKMRKWLTLGKGLAISVASQSGQDGERWYRPGVKSLEGVSGGQPMLPRLASLSVLSLALVLAFTSDAEAGRRKGGCGNSCGPSCGYHGCGSCYSGCGAGYTGCGGCGGCYYGDPGHHGHGKRRAEGPAPATILVTLPADAQLTIDGHQTTSTTFTRLFATPELAPDKEFTYTLKAVFTHEGETHTVTKQVTVRAGEETRVTLEPSVATAGR